MASLLQYIRKHYRTAFAIGMLIVVFYFSLQQGFVLFHTVVELLSIVIAFAAFIVTWNSRRMMDNNYLYFIGISYLFVASLDLLHTLTFNNMHLIGNPADYMTTQFWICARSVQALSLLLGFVFLDRRRKVSADLIFVVYLVVTVLLVLSILYWHIFPQCYIEGHGLTPFKIYTEYSIIAILFLVGYLLINRRDKFDPLVYRLLLASMIFIVLGEFCFTQYRNNFAIENEIGHYAKLIAFFLIYKANVETGFKKPTGLIFKNLAENEEQYRALAENMPGHIMRFDGDLHCIYANTHQDSSLPVPLDDSMKDLLVLAQRSRQPQATTIQTSQDGVFYAYAVQAIPEYKRRSDKESYLVICQDITALKQTEQELQELNATKDKLFSIIAHDLRNPFTSLLSFSDLIYKNADKLKKEKIEQMALRMNESARQAYALLENLLNWSRIQTGILKPNRQPLDALELLEEAARFGFPMAQAKNIEVVTTPGQPQQISADRHMMSTILRNLISNAIKFSYSGSSIVLGVQQQPNYVIFSVADSGIGIEKENLEKLLKIDSKLSTPGTAEEKGTGLGLVLCKEFVELNGGKLWLQSEFGMGTTFYFSVPVAG